MLARRHIAFLLIVTGLLSVACRSDAVVEVPQRLYRVRMLASSVEVGSDGTAVIPFEADCPADALPQVRLLQRDGMEPEAFSLRGISEAGPGRYLAGICDSGTLEAYSLEVCLSFEDAGGQQLSATPEYVCVNCGPPSFGPGVDTGLPVIYIDTADGQAPRHKELEAQARISVRGAGGFASMAPASCVIGGRGNISWNWPKKPWELRFRDDVPLLGMDAHHSWVLLANFGDRTLMRNLVSMKVSSLTSLDWTPSCVPVELVLNGSHMGSYLLIEKIDVCAGRVNLSPDGGCLLELDFHLDNALQWVDPHGFSRLGFGIPFAVRYPSAGDASEERLSEIRNYVYDAAAALYSDSFTDPVKGYAGWLDVDSFVDYWIVYEALGNYELGNPGSVYMHRDAGGRLRAGPCWDFDWVLSRTGTDIQALAGTLNTAAIWYERLFRDPAFAEKVRVRFLELRPSLEGVAEYIDSCASLLERSAELNFRLWDPAQDRWSNNGLLINGDENLEFGDAVARLREVWLDRLELIGKLL